MSAFFLLLGFSRNEIERDRTDDLASYINLNSTFFLHGRVEGNVDDRGDYVKIFFKVSKIEINNEEKIVNGRVLATLFKYPQVYNGDFLILKGTLQDPSLVSGDSYKNYLKIYRTYSVIFYPNIVFYQKNKSFSVLLKLFEFKRNILAKLGLIYHEPCSSFVAGILLGEKRSVPEDLMNAFNKAGLSHVLVVSGYNISLILIFVLAVFKFLPKWIRLIVAIFFIFLFALLVGLSASVVRAVLMSVLGVLTLLLGRKSYISLSILWSAFFMCFYNPSVFFYDDSFKLSFGSTIGICYFSSYVQNILKRTPLPEIVQSILVPTFASQILLLPYIWYRFGNFPLFSPLSNLLVLPLIPLVMLLGAVTLFVSFFSLGLAQIIGYAAVLPMEFIFWVVRILGKI